MTPLSHFTDAALVARVRLTNDGAAWAELEARSAPLLKPLLLSLLAAGGKAGRGALGEVTRDSLARAYEKLDLYDPSRPWRCWLRALAANVAYDWLRAARRHGHAGLDGLAAWAEDERLGEAREAVVESIRRLDAVDRSLLVRFLLGEHPSRLAADVGRAEPTVRSRLCESKKQILACLGSPKLSNAQVQSLLSGCDLESLLA